MKIANLISTFLITILLLLTQGCSFEKAIPSEKDGRSPSRTPVSTSEFLPLATRTPEPEATAVITPTILHPIASLTKENKLPTAIPLPTIPAEQATNELALILSEAPGCDMPCFFGITPGATTLITAGKIFDRFVSLDVGNIQSDTGGFHGLKVPTPEGMLNVVVEYDSNGRVVNFITGHIEIEKDYAVVNDPLLNQQYFKSYTLSSWLSKYGPPTEVLLYLEKGRDLYSLAIYYADRNSFFEYEGSAEPRGDRYRICPTGGTPMFSTWSAEVEIDLEKILTGTTPVRRMGIGEYYLPIKTAMGMSVEQFTDKFGGSPEACFLTPESLWPKS